MNSVNDNGELIIVGIVEDGRTGRLSTRITLLERDSITVTVPLINICSNVSFALQINFCCFTLS